MRKYHCVRFADNLVNLTGEIICLYEETSGAIASFSPEFEMGLQEIPIAEKLPNHYPSKHYVVDREGYLFLKEIGQDLGNIAVISRVVPGREGEVVYLFWGKDPTYDVLLYNGQYSELAC